MGGGCTSVVKIVAQCVVTIKIYIFNTLMVITLIKPDFRIYLEMIVIIHRCKMIKNKYQKFIDEMSNILSYSFNPDMNSLLSISSI